MANSPLDVDPPLSLEPIVGWRVWGLDRVGGALTLRSVTRPVHWPAKHVMVATCIRHRAWTVPDERCTCGLYAAASPDYLARSGVLRIGSSVVGTVSMWGRVIEHTRGARSRFAYPARLRLVCEPCLSVGAGAVTPVRVLGDHGSLTAVCRTHWSGPTAHADLAADVEAELLSTYGVELLPIEQLSGGLRARPVRISRPSAPAAPSIETRRVRVERVMICLYFVAQIISTLMQPDADASVAQTDVTSSPSAVVSPARSGQLVVKEPTEPNVALRYSCDIPARPSACEDAAQTPPANLSDTEEGQRLKSSSAHEGPFRLDRNRRQKRNP